MFYHPANTTRLERCFVRLYKKYKEFSPPSTEPNTFYLQPSRNPTATCWFTYKPIGHNALQNTLSRNCKLAGLNGFHTNYSFLATAATRLYNSGVDEQLVMETTGHMSLEGVKSYKRTSSEQRETLSDILACTILYHLEIIVKYLSVLPPASAALPSKQVEQL